MRIVTESRLLLHRRIEESLREFAMKLLCHLIIATYLRMASARINSGRSEEGEGEGEGEGLGTFRH